jgi:DNA-binding transcriptional ArsR family regulator
MERCGKPGATVNGMAGAGSVPREVVYSNLLRDVNCKLTLTKELFYTLHVDRVLKALADGTRRRILALVWGEARTAGAIAARFAMTRPAISHHLGVLLEGELVTLRRQGTRRLYRANRQTLARLRIQLGAFWDSHLQHLKDAAEARERRRGRN